MNIFFKSFFILFSFLCIYPYSSVLGMQKQNLKQPEYDIEHHDYKLTILVQPGIHNCELIKEEKDQYFLGFDWAKKTSILNEETYQRIYYPGQNIKTEWCKKTYALLGTLFCWYCYRYRLLFLIGLRKNNYIRDIQK